jgi:hypothetical protein
MAKGVSEVEGTPDWIVETANEEGLSVLRLFANHNSVAFELDEIFELTLVTDIGDLSELLTTFESAGVVCKKGAYFYASEDLEQNDEEYLIRMQNFSATPLQ